MNRDKFPEKVPFRLTRMLIKALEVSGIEGSYRSTCERTMTVLRENRDSLLAMLEAFLYDPLISWRLVDLSNSNGNMGDGFNASRGQFMERALSSPSGAIPEDGTFDVDSGVPIDVAGRSGVLPISEGNEDVDDDGENESGDMALPDSVHDIVPSAPIRHPREAAMSATRARSLQMYSNIQTWAANLHGADERIASITGGDGASQMAASGSVARSRMAERSMRQRELLNLLDGEDGLAAAEDVLNEKALRVIRRVQDKLAGTDFEDGAENVEPLDVVDQVQRLIVQATSVEILSQLYIGWCAFW